MAVEAVGIGAGGAGVAINAPSSHASGAATVQARQAAWWAWDTGARGRVKAVAGKALDAGGRSSTTIAAKLVPATGAAANMCVKTVRVDTAGTDSRVVAAHGAKRVVALTAAIIHNARSIGACVRGNGRCSSEEDGDKEQGWPSFVHHRSIGRVVM